MPETPVNSEMAELQRYCIRRLDEAVNSGKISSLEHSIDPENQWVSGKADNLYFWILSAGAGFSRFKKAKKCKWLPFISIRDKYDLSYDESEYASLQQLADTFVRELCDVNDELKNALKHT